MIPPVSAAALLDCTALQKGGWRPLWQLRRCQGNDLWDALDGSEARITARAARALTWFAEVLGGEGVGMGNRGCLTSQHYSRYGVDWL